MVRFRDIFHDGKDCLRITDIEHEDKDPTFLPIYRPAIGHFANLKDTFNAKAEPGEWSRLINVGPHHSVIPLVSSHDHVDEEHTKPYTSLGRRIKEGNLTWPEDAKIFQDVPFIKKYWEWTEDVLSHFRKNLKDAGLYEAIYASLFTFDCDKIVLQKFCESWCSETNSVHTSSGEVSISLWDLHKLGGLPITGEFYDEVIPCTSELISSDRQGVHHLSRSCRYLFAAFHKLRKKFKSESRIVGFSEWINFWFQGRARYSTKNLNPSFPSGNIGKHAPWIESRKAFIQLKVGRDIEQTTYLAAFLSCWLCLFALPNGRPIRPGTFKIASLMAKGNQVSLAIPVLAKIYRGMRNAETAFGGKLKTTCSHYIYAWLGVYFKAYGSVNHEKSIPLMTQFSGKRMMYKSSEAQEIISSGKYLNRYLLTRKGLEKMYTDDGNMEPDDFSYYISIRSGYLTLRLNNCHVVEPYSPYRFSQQFGFHQRQIKDIIPRPQNGTLEELYGYYTCMIRSATMSSTLFPRCSIDTNGRTCPGFSPWWTSVGANFSIITEDMSSTIKKQNTIGESEKSRTIPPVQQCSHQLAIDTNNEEIDHNRAKESSHQKRLSESIDEHDSASEANWKHKKSRNEVETLPKEINEEDSSTSFSSGRKNSQNSALNMQAFLVESTPPLNKQSPCIEVSEYPCDDVVTKFRHEHCENLVTSVLSKLTRLPLEGVAPFRAYIRRICGEMDGQLHGTGTKLLSAYEEFAMRVQKHLNHGVGLQKVTMTNFTTQTEEIKTKLSIVEDQKIVIKAKIESFHSLYAQKGEMIHKLQEEQESLKLSIAEREKALADADSSSMDLGKMFSELQSKTVISDDELLAYEKTRSLLEEDLQYFKNIKWLP